MAKMSFGDQLSDNLAPKSFRNYPFSTAVGVAEFTKEFNLWKLRTDFFDRLTVEADINQRMSTRGEL
jgi:hypothetical protein